MVALMRLLAVVVGSMAGAHVYGAGHGTGLALAIAVGAAASVYWLGSMGARRMPTSDPTTPVDLDRALPMRKDVSSARRRRNRRVLLRDDADAPPS